VPPSKLPCNTCCIKKNSVIEVIRILAIEVRVCRTLDARGERLVTGGSSSHFQIAQSVHKPP
jgi:hypothetical protein